MPRPALSVLLPFRNAESTLASCLESIRVQGLTDYELLAVDDHSTDGSLPLVMACARTDPRIRIIRPPTRGLVPALNEGLNAARSELIARMDADDLMHRERLERQHSYLRGHPEISVLGTRVEVISDGPVLAGLREYVRWQNLCVSPDEIAADIYLESPFAHPSVMFRRDSILRAGGYLQGAFPEDYELWLRLLGRGEQMAKLPQVLLHWRDRQDRVSRTDPRCSRPSFDRLRASYLARDPRLSEYRRDLVVWGAGRKTRRRVSRLLREGFDPVAWIDIDPHKLGKRIGSAPVVPPEWLNREPKPLVLCYVARHGARALIEERLNAMGYRKGTDYLQVG
jgi:glycosyltransferase involved in cell wall biosynthesis